jgi:hypothetical protein
MKLKLLTAMLFVLIINPFNGFSSPSPIWWIGIKVTLGHGSDCIGRGICSVSLGGGSGNGSFKSQVPGKLENIEGKLSLTLYEDSLSSELKKIQFEGGKFVMEEPLTLPANVCKELKLPKGYLIKKGEYTFKKIKLRELIIYFDPLPAKTIDSQEVPIKFGTLAKLYSTVVYLEVKDTYKAGMTEDQFCDQLLKQTGDGQARSFFRDFYKWLYPCCVSNCDPDTFYRTANGDAFSKLLKNIKPLIQNWSKGQPANKINKEALLKYLAPNYNGPEEQQGKAFNRIRKTIEIILDAWNRIDIVWE